jgi:hypothetical protein
MSVAFISLFDASSEQVTSEWLFSKLEANPSFAAPIVDRCKAYCPPQSWVIEGWSVNGLPELHGPGGFAIQVRPRTIELYHMLRFTVFTSDLVFRNAMRDACLWIADLVGSPRAIYTHECMPYEGEGLGQIELALRGRIGPPSVTFADLHSAKQYGRGAWYIDSFEDLRSSQP